MRAEHSGIDAKGLFIRPSEIYDSRSQRFEERKKELERLTNEVKEQTDICLRLKKKEEERTRHLNPVVEQGIGDEDQMGEEEEEESTSVGQVRRGGLGPDVAAEEEKAADLGEEEGEEGREAVAAPSPKSPSRLEKENHELTHTPYRSWCPHCVRMRGRNTAHKKQEKKEKSWIPRISFDYFFFSQEEEHANTNPMIVMVDEETGENMREESRKKG